MLLALVAKVQYVFSFATTCEMYRDLSELLNEFKDVFLSDLLTKLPLLRDIQHARDLVSGSPSPNLPYHRMKPSNRK